MEKQQLSKTKRKMTISKKMSQAAEVLTQKFGYQELHPTQEKAVKSILSKKDTFVLMPTGGGKSICYQLPALVLKGTAIVVSPLIALMKDQVDSLRANNITAEYLNSSLTTEEYSSIRQKLLTGKIKILYVSAERLISSQFTKVLKKIKISLFAIDEAHCISSWGHDFRPSYTKLSHLKKQFSKVPIIALTATADTDTKKDIISQLELDKPKIFSNSFDRPNISLSVVPGSNKIDTITTFLSDKTGQPGIIYCLTRKQTQAVAKKLQSQGITAASYHAGLSSTDRSRIQKSFIRDKTQVICATIAFGMGIDKSNIRWIIHYNLPKSLEGYYQEIGRAGRDSSLSHAVLLYSFSDVEYIKKFFIDRSQGNLQLAKLEKMKEYAEGVICRRKILLNYFGEDYKKKCHHCDNCAHPYKFMNITQSTAIAYQVLYTLHSNSTENLKNNMQRYTKLSTKQLVSVLSKVYPTTNAASWHFYLAQLKNLGLITTSFARYHELSLSKKGISVLENDKKVRLVTLDTYIKRQEN